MQLYSGARTGEPMIYKEKGPDVPPSSPSVQLCPTKAAVLFGLIKRKGLVMKIIIRRN